jgi:Mg2+ and Co2+ transporter CorA
VLEDLLFYWKKERPPGFNSEDPSILSLAYYPLRIVAAEWVSYVEVLSHSIKQFEYSTEASTESEALAKLDLDLCTLEVWGRRSMQTLYKLRSVIRFIQSRNKTGPAQEEYTLIVEDYRHIVTMVEAFGRRLEAMIPVVTSLVQIADARRSVKEVANVNRLTNLALLFVPLSFITGLFSMNNGVTGHSLRLYFSVAIPLCLFFFFVARLLPYINIGMITRRVRRLRSASSVEVEV